MTGVMDWDAAYRHEIFMGPPPNQVTEAEVRDAVAQHGAEVTTQPSFVAVKLPDIPGLPSHNFPVDEAGRVQLLTARKV